VTDEYDDAVRDLKAFAAVILASIGFLLLPYTVGDVLYLFPSLCFIFLGLALAIEADD